MCWGNIEANSVASITLPQTYSNTNYIVLTTNKDYSNRGWFVDNMCLNKIITGWDNYRLTLSSNNNQTGHFNWIAVDYMSIGY